MDWRLWVKRAAGVLFIVLGILFLFSNGAGAAARAAGNDGGASTRSG
jgi:hypothetical protein